MQRLSSLYLEISRSYIMSGSNMIDELWLRVHELKQWHENAVSDIREAASKV